jgi:hypothetical protein
MTDDELRQEAMKAIEFHRRQYEMAIEPWLERLATLNALRSPAPILLDKETADSLGIRTADRETAND